MKNLVALLVVIPTALAVFLFGIAAMSFHTPWLLDAAVSGPWVAVICIIFGVIASLPLIITVISGIVSAISNHKHEDRENENEE